MSPVKASSISFFSRDQCQRNSKNKIVDALKSAGEHSGIKMKGIPLRKIALAAIFAFSAIAPSKSVVAADQQPTPEVICTGKHPTKPGFVCSDGTRLSLFGGVEVQERDKTPHFNVSRKLLKISTRIELQQCKNGMDYTYCNDNPWDDIDFVSVENETDCIDKARFIAFEKWLRASRQGFAPSITWSCM